MSPLIRFFTIALVYLVLLSNANALTDKFAPDVSEYQLSNGLRLVVIPDRRAPVVTHMIWYQVGSADDPPGKSGIAHFLEHLMFKGTKSVPPGEFSQAITAIGGQENAFTSYDYTAYFQKISPNALPEMMRYEADRMRNLVLEDKIVYPERDVILEERSGRVDDNPASILSEFVQSALFVHHPYGVPIIGWEHEIAKLEKADILNFYETWYQPWNAIVVVTGDVEPEQVFAYARKTYGNIEESRPKKERKRISDPTRVVSKTLAYSDSRVTSPVWRRTFVVPSYRTGDALENESLDLLAAILGQSVKSRIYESLVLGTETATSAGAFYQGTAIDEGYFGLFATPRGDTSLDDLEEAMEDQIDQIRNDGITQEELDRARRNLIQSVVFSQDSQVVLARIFGAVLATGGSIEDVTTWSEKMQKVTVEDIHSVARKYLVRNQAVTSRLLPASE